jgi:enamine deaminase RidA (YjgF/YER057c/UK114 family)
MMSASVPRVRERQTVQSGLGGPGQPASNRPARLVNSSRASRATAGTGYSLVDLGDSTRVALVLVPRSGGTFAEQAQEVFSELVAILQGQRQPMVVTVQTVFLRDARDQAEAERLLAGFCGTALPVTNFVWQPPCDGAALAVEAWAIGGDSVRVERYSPCTLAVSYDAVRWVYCAGLKSDAAVGGVYAQSLDVLGRMRQDLAKARSQFEHVVRTWFYLGGITDREQEAERYQELNRARVDFYRDIPFGDSLGKGAAPRPIYPASTGIGMAGKGLVASCLTLETSRNDVRLLPIENPQQTPAYVYNSRYSPQSPKFSRGMALVLGDYATTWISGTASIVGSETRYPGHIEKQTEQTIENIERLIGSDNFLRHGVKGTGATLSDLAKIRVYLKRPEDFARCKAVCERRFGSVPALYARADICRPELLVEIEGVAFSRCAPMQPPR